MGIEEKAKEYVRKEIIPELGDTMILSPIISAAIMMQSESSFTTGAEWMQSELIEKAVEWFKHQKEEIGISRFDDFEIRFRKAMEE